MLAHFPSFYILTSQETTACTKYVCSKMLHACDKGENGHILYMQSLVSVVPPSSSVAVPFNATFTSH